MALYNIGNFIKHRREELGITQEELSEGICSVATLSRLENGGRMPTKNHAQALLQRLGYSDALPFYVSGKEEFEISELQLKTRLAYMRNDFDTAKELLDKLGEYKEFFSPTDRQYYEMMYTSTHQDELTNSEVLERFESALKITHKYYDINHLPTVLSFEEATALNNIAIRYDIANERNTAIEILYHLKRYYEKHIVDMEETRRVLPTIIYNLSKVLGLSGRYDECIEVCNQGIAFAKEYIRCENLAQILYNLSWSLIKRGYVCDIESAKQAAKEAYCLCKIIGNRPKLLERLRVFIKDNFAEDPPLL